MGGFFPIVMVMVIRINYSILAGLPGVSILAGLPGVARVFIGLYQYSAKDLSVEIMSSRDYVRGGYGNEDIVSVEEAMLFKLPQSSAGLKL